MVRIERSEDPGQNLNASYRIGDRVASGIEWTRGLFHVIKFIWSVLSSDCRFCWLYFVFDFFFFFLMCDELRLWNFCFHLSLCSCTNSPWVQSQLIPWCQVATWRLCLLPLTLNRPWTSDCPWQLPVQMADYIKVISGPQRCLSCFWVWLGFVSLFLFLSLFKKKKIILAVLGASCCVWAFSSCSGFPCCKALVLGIRASVVVVVQT